VLQPFGGGPADLRRVVELLRERFGAVALADRGQRARRFEPQPPVAAVCGLDQVRNGVRTHADDLLARLLAADTVAAVHRAQQFLDLRRGAVEVVVDAARRPVLGLVEPRPRLGDPLQRVVADARHRERLAEQRQSVLPRLLTGDRDAVDAVEVGDAELQVVPERARRPAVEVAHLEQQVHTFVLLDVAIDPGHERLVVGGRELAGDLDVQHVAVRFGEHFDGHERSAPSPPVGRGRGAAALAPAGRASGALRDRTTGSW
jgi:hypothetical protein